MTPVFVDVAKPSGIDFTFFDDSVKDRFFLPEVMGGGTGWLDYDQNGTLDLFLAQGSVLDPKLPKDRVQSDRIYSQVGLGQFIDVSESARIDDLEYGQGVTVFDYDADGFDDVFVGCYGRDLLFHNQGDGTFVERAFEAQTSDEWWTSSSCVFDLNDDGLLDFYAANYMDVTLANSKVCRFSGQPGYCGPGDYTGVQDAVYVNQGDGTFKNIAIEKGFQKPIHLSKGLAVVCSDLDMDLIPEIYVANDMTPNFLFRRKPTSSNQEVAYEEIGELAGVATDEKGHHEASMGIAVADFDADQLPEIYLTHFYLHKNTLYKNLGKLKFADKSRITGVASTSLDFNGFGVFPFDLDRDMDQDLILVNGHVLGPNHVPNEMTSQILVNNTGTTFVDASRFAGSFFTKKALARSLAAADYDNDGDFDFAITYIESPFSLLKNDSTNSGSHFIGLELSNTDRRFLGGSRVEITVGGKTQTFPIQSGGSYLATHDSRLLIGLSNNSGPVDIRIYWNNGKLVEYRELKVDRYWLLSENGSAIDTLTLPE